MDVPPVKIIWCDSTFENEHSHQAMLEEFNETTTGAERRAADPIDTAILDEEKEELRSNGVPLTTVRTADDVFREIQQNPEKKIVVICSGSLGRYLVPVIARRYPLVHKVYIYAHNILLHVDWADNYISMVRLFDFHTNLLVRLTRDISSHFIARGRMFLGVEDPGKAREYFLHARNLENAANRRDRRAFNPDAPDQIAAHPDFRDHLDLLEGEKGLIAQAEVALRQRDERGFENS